jgi:predicted RNase H-like nuclease
MLIDIWSRIVLRLDAEIEGTAKALTLPTVGQRTAELKAFEDKLDAVVCAWVAICALEQRATPFGDEDAAIWIPTV